MELERIHGVLIEGGAEDDPRSGGGEGGGHLHTRAARHLDVEEDQVRLETQDRLDRLLAVPGLAHDLQIVEGGEQLPQALARGLFVVDEKDADHPAAHPGHDHGDVVLLGGRTAEPIDLLEYEITQLGRRSTRVPPDQHVQRVVAQLLLRGVPRLGHAVGERQQDVAGDEGHGFLPIPRVDEKSHDGSARLETPGPQGTAVAGVRSEKERCRMPGVDVGQAAAGVVVERDEEGGIAIRVDGRMHRPVDLAHESFQVAAVEGRETLQPRLETRHEQPREQSLSRDITQCDRQPALTDGKKIVVVAPDTPRRAADAAVIETRGDTIAPGIKTRLCERGIRDLALEVLPLAHRVAHAVDGPGEAIPVERLQEVVQSVMLERVDGVLIERGAEDDSGARRR